MPPFGWLLRCEMGIIDGRVHACNANAYGPILSLTFSRDGERDTARKGVNGREKIMKELQSVL